MKNPSDINLEYSEVITPEQMAIILNHINTQKGDTFKPTIIYDKEVANLSVYFKKLKDDVLDGKIDKFPYNKTFILVSELIRGIVEHYSCFHLQVTGTKDEPLLQIFVIDSLGAKAVHNRIYLNILDQARFEFKHALKAYRSQYEMQKDGHSCGVYAIMFARMIHSLLYGKFKTCYPEFDLFAYLVKNVINVKSCGFKMVNDIPAKFMQADQRCFMDNYICPIDPAAVVNSKGVKLIEALQSYKVDFTDEEGVQYSWNSKINQQSVKFKNICVLFNKSHDAQYLTEITNQYSFADLIGSQQQPTKLKNIRF